VFVHCVLLIIRQQSAIYYLISHPSLAVMSIVNSISVFKSSNQNQHLSSANNIMRAEWIVCARDATSFRNLEFFVLTAIMSNSDNVLMSLNIQGRRTVTKPKMNINYTGVNVVNE